ncbi:hypothetical protein CC79DRAFT_1070854 [Sarocladium strictum]
MANTRVEPDRDHSQKVPRPHQTSNTAAEGSEPSVFFNSGHFPPALYSFDTMPSVDQRTSGAKIHQQGRTSADHMEVPVDTLPVLRFPQKSYPREQQQYHSRNITDSETANWTQLAPQRPTSGMEDLAVKKPSPARHLRVPGLHPLRTSANLLQSSSGPGSGALTPNTASSLGGHRWTPLSAQGSTSSASSSLLPVWRPFSSSPTDRFTPSTYAAQSPWNDSGSKQQIMNENALDFGGPVQRQLFREEERQSPAADGFQPVNRSHNPGFRPMDALLPMPQPSQQLVPPPGPFSHQLDGCAQAYLPSFSSRYCGKHVDSNASADHLLPDQNCALWLTNLPPIVTYTQLLGSIRHFGRIWCTYINEPNNREHVTAAAKVVFFSAQAAAAFLHAAWPSDMRGPMMIQGYPIKVAYNRIKYPEKPCGQGESRVLIVTGHPMFVNEEALSAFFRQRFIYQVDRVQTLIQTTSRAVVEFSFGSYRCQSQMGLMALEKDRPIGFEKVEYGEDPCEVGDTFSSYSVAMDRIRGIGL